MDSIVAALEGAFWVLNDSQHTFYTAKAVCDMLGNKRSRRSGGKVYEPPTLLLMQQIFATAKCRKVLKTQYGAQWQKCSLSGQSIPSGEEAEDAFNIGFQMKIDATVDVTDLATNVKKAYGGSLQRTEASEGRRGLVDLATVEQKGNFPESGGNFDDDALTGA